MRLVVDQKLLGFPEEDYKLKQELISCSNNSVVCNVCTKKGL